VYGASTLATEILRNRFYHRFLHDFFLVFGALALLLTALGLFGVINFANAARRRELGVRLALGASPARIAGHTLFPAVGSVVAPAIPGLFLGIALGTGMRRFLVDVSPGDMQVAIGALLVVLAAGCLSVAVPSLRAARLDPSEVLRTD
jgi:ABC-type antimicrobial peptide transport system permease subunit